MKIPLYKIYWDEEDVEAVTKVIRRGSYWSAGPEVEELEKEISSFIGRKYSVTFNSGSSALHALFLAYDFGKNMKIAAPSFTFNSSINSTILAGYSPTFVDIEENYLGINPDDLRNVSAKAVLPTHIGGCPCQIETIKEIADQRGMVLIEDSAESLGASIKGRGLVGSFGDSAIFSFSGNKVVTAGEGGVVVTDSKKLFDRMSAIKSHGVDLHEDPPKSSLSKTYTRFGCNWRMSDLTASLALSQFKKLKKLIEMRVRNAEYLSSRLQSISGIKCPVQWKDRSQTFQMYTIKVADVSTRDKLRQYLEKAGITTKIYFEPLHLEPLYKSYRSKSALSVTESVSSRVVTLPMYPDFTKPEMDYLAEKISDFFKNLN